MRTVAELFCDRYRVPPASYARAMFWRALHRRALPIAPLLLWVHPEFFGADFDLIEGVGRLTDLHDLADEWDDFRSHPLSGGLLRDRLKIRVSFGRLRRVVLTLLPPAECTRLAGGDGLG